MSRVTKHCAFAVLILVFSSSATAASGKPAQLQCDSLVTPLGVDDPQPLFSWQLQDDRYGAKQTAYQLQVATQTSILSTKPDIWDSGRVQSDQSVGVAYGG